MKDPSGHDLPQEVKASFDSEETSIVPLIDALSSRTQYQLCNVFAKDLQLKLSQEETRPEGRSIEIPASIATRSKSWKRETDSGQSAPGWGRPR